MQANELKITAIPAFDDNYIWLITAGGNNCAVVDPGDANPVLDILEQKGLQLTYILLTHHHYDHVGGVSELLKKYPTKVFGPADERIAFKQQVCREGDQVHLPELNVKFNVLEVRSVSVVDGFLRVRQRTCKNPSTNSRPSRPTHGFIVRMNIPRQIAGLLSQWNRTMPPYRSKHWKSGT
jgi:ribonuclease BN (tRNA processing enzyme)